LAVDHINLCQCKICLITYDDIYEALEHNKTVPFLIRRRQNAVGATVPVPFAITRRKIPVYANQNTIYVLPGNEDLQIYPYSKNEETILIKSRDLAQISP
jgi:hypothetical protein